MMKKFFVEKYGFNILVNDDVCLGYLKTIEDGKYLCELTQPKSKEEIRRLAQNRLYWRWLTDFEETKVNSAAGTLKEGWHKKFKFDYLVPIYIRDDEEFAAMFTALEMVLREIGKSVYERLLDGIIRETSTTKASVKQFSEYLNCISDFANEKGVILTTDKYLIELAKIYD